jgi:hypothetical protein
MENTSMTLPKGTLAKYMNPVFLETGSYDGRTIQMALDVGFKEVRSIEIAKRYYDMCCMRFSGNDSVKLWHGDSLSLLAAMIADIKEPVTFWLDAHIQEGYLGQLAVPTLKELEIIADHPIKTHTILVDDRRLMGTTGTLWQNVLEYDVIRYMRRINPNYEISYEDNNVEKDDIIVAQVKV